MRHLCGDDAPSRASATKRHWCGGRPRDPWAWLPCPWAVAGPGRAIHSDLALLVWRAPEGPEGTGCGARGRWRGQAAVLVGGGRARAGLEANRTQHNRPTGVEGAGGTGGPGCGARGWWRGLAGLRDDAPSEARGADGSRAGRRPRAHKAARPARARQVPEHRWHHKQHDVPRHAETPPRGCGTGFSLPSRV